MNEDLREHINVSLKAGIRLDGRRNEEFRDIEIECGVVKTAEGSARVRCGNTEVIVGIKLDIGKPFADRPDEGVLMVGAELLPLSNPQFESGPPSEQAIEVARVIDRGLREAHALDLSSLCIARGEKVWMIQVDVCPLNTDGNLIDIGALAAVAALRDARFPAVVDGVVDYKHKSDKPLPMHALPVTVTAVRIGDNLLLDPTDEEESLLDSRLTVAVKGDGEICALQKGGAGSLTFEEIRAMVDLCHQKSHDLRKVLEGAR